MVAPILYRSTDASAPSLTGNPGSLITVLDACLVNGYGSKAAAGWTKDYSGTNKAAYRMGAGGVADRMFLRVWDDNTGTGQWAYIQGYRTMSAIDVGASPFAPYSKINVSNTNGLRAAKANGNAQAAVAWALIASPTAFYIFIEYNTNAALLGSGTIQSGQVYYGGFFFGEYKKRYVGHNLNVAIIGSHNGDTSQPFYGGALGKRVSPANSFGSDFSGFGAHWLARSFAGFDGPEVFQNAALSYWSNSAASDSTGFGAGGPGLNPSIVDSKLRISKIEMVVNAPNWEIMGEMPGAYSSLGQYWLPGNTIVEGVGTLAGNSYWVGHCATASNIGSSYQSYPSQMLINLTDWA